MRRILSLLRLGSALLGWAALPFRVVAPLTVSVMWGPSSGFWPDPCQAGMAVLSAMNCLWCPSLGRRVRGGLGAGTGAPVAVPLAQGGDLIFEVGERLEPSVDRGEPEVGHLVQIPQRAQDGQADLVRGDLAQPPCPDRLLHLLGQDRQLVLADRPSLACPLHATDDLVPGEGLGDTAALGDHQDDRLLGGEPPPALRARPAAADRGAIVGRAAVDDPAIGIPAERAVHAITSLAAVRVPRPLVRVHQLVYQRTQLVEKTHRCKY